MKTIRLFSMLTAMIMLLTTLTACSDDKKNDSTVSKTGAVGYVFDDTTEMLKVSGSKYKVFSNRKIKIDYKDTDYKKILSYKSPYKDYIGDIYYDTKNGNTLTDTAALAIIYAYEHNVETIDFPVEFDTATLNDAWEVVCLAYPNIPCDLTTSYYERSEDGLYRLRLSKSVRKVANNDKTIKTAKKILDSMPKDCKTDAQKAFYLYDWICKNVVYDKHHADNNIGIADATPQSAYGELVEKRAVCDGIAGGLQLLFKMAGIECSKLSGFTGKDGQGHVWNTAVIDGEVWDFDATWDIYRDYTGADDTIKEYDNVNGGYSWFGYNRTTEAKNLIIYDIPAACAPNTNTEFTEKSPALLAYDFCFNSPEDVYIGSKKLAKDATLLNEIKNELDKKDTIRLVFTNTDTFMIFLLDFKTSKEQYKGITIKDAYPPLLCVQLSKE